MKTEYEKCMAGEPFIGSRDPKIVEMILRTKRLLAQFNATDYADSKRRRELLCEMLGHVGKNVHVDIDFHCECGKHIFMGDKVIVNMNCTFVDNNRIDIGSNVLIASNVQIYTATHSTKVDERMVQDCPEEQEICRTYALPVRIEDGVWIGGGVVILPGVTIGRNSLPRRCAGSRCSACSSRPWGRCNRFVPTSVAHIYRLSTRRKNSDRCRRRGREHPV